MACYTTCCGYLSQMDTPFLVLRAFSGGAFCWDCFCQEGNARCDSAWLRGGLLGCFPGSRKAHRIFDLDVWMRFGLRLCQLSTASKRLAVFLHVAFISCLACVAYRRPHVYFFRAGQ